MSKLITKEDFIAATRLGRFKLESLADLLMEVIRVNKINSMYAELSRDKKGMAFIDTVLEALQLSFEVEEDDLKNIPDEGGFITVSNHPYGGIDGMILLRIVADQRPDYKVMANFLLERIEPLKEYFLPVNPFEDERELRSSLAGIKKALSHLQQGHPMGLFPAGEVSSFDLGKKAITDKEWQPSALRFIQKSGVPVVPIYFQGSNSLLFNLLGIIHPKLRTAKLPSELLNKKQSVVKVRIGKPIAAEELAAFDDVQRMGRFLRAKTYALSSAIEVKKFFSYPRIPRLKSPEEIVPTAGLDNIRQELQSIREDCHLFTQKQFEAYIAPASRIPTIMHEIGRLREITFREVGEGTNRKIDLDEFDLYYHHLFLWDKEEEKLVGGYRLGKGGVIMSRYGMKGFYTLTLFKMDRQMEPIMEQAIELGRSFIVKEYQTKLLPLFLLWKGILHFLIRNPEYRYLIGPVSISNRYSEVSKSLLIEFIKRNYYNDAMAQHVHPRKPFKPKVKKVDLEILLEKSGDDLNKLDKYIEDIETSHHGIPILLKKYIKQNARIIAFNVDPLFENSLDGLIILDLEDVPPETIEGLKREMNQE